MRLILKFLVLCICLLGISSGVVGMTVIGELFKEKKYKIIAIIICLYTALLSWYTILTLF